MSETPMAAPRNLTIVADDFGIGPETSRGILELAALGRVTGAVFLVNSPFAESAARSWRAAGEPLELGWHPCLTLDRPVLTPGKVPSLVDAAGLFPNLGILMKRLALGRLKASEIEAEFRAQLDRFRQLVGHPPRYVNAHHHVSVFPVVGRVLRTILGEQKPLPYLRCVREPARTLLAVPGARCKRIFLNSLGRIQARRQCAAGFPGNDWLAGIADADNLRPEFFPQWLAAMPGQAVELMVHPGHADDTLLGRDESLQCRRPWEWNMLRDPAFEQLCRDAGFRLISPSAFLPSATRQAN